MSTHDILALGLHILRVPASAEAREGGFSMARVLIVEDEHALRRILTLNLVRRGHTVVEAEGIATADEACAALAATGHTFDVILLDINLPDQTGWDLLRHQQECVAGPRASAGTGESEAHGETHNPRVIVVTAIRPAQSRLDEFRPAAVLLKPFPIVALLRLIERVLDGGIVPAGMPFNDTGEGGALSTNAREAARR